MAPSRLQLALHYLPIDRFIGVVWRAHKPALSVWCNTTFASLLLLLLVPGVLHAMTFIQVQALAFLGNSWANTVAASLDAVVMVGFTLVLFMSVGIIDQHVDSLAAAWLAQQRHRVWYHCVAVGSKLRVRIISPGYLPSK